MPREVHEHFTLTTPGDPSSGVLTGYTVITRESEWDDETRARALALYEYENSLCACGCNRPATESREPTPYVIHEAKCYAGRALEQHRRTQREKHENAPDGWDDGVHYFAVPATAAEVEAATNKNRKRGVKRGDRAHSPRPDQG
jgi:hypothetical protein